MRISLLSKSFIIIELYILEDAGGLVNKVQHVDDDVIFHVVLRSCRESD